ncbi:MAG TPA: hypothetical protein VK668_08025 [Mucilaginibacter sp.]|nr:hypothetical protein [Mucilaginibacter sp.]
MNRKIGVALMVFGASMLIWISFAPPQKEKLTDVEPKHYSVEKNKPVNWLPYLGTVLVAGGLVLVITGKK